MKTKKILSVIMIFFILTSSLIADDISFLRLKQYWKKTKTVDKKFGLFKESHLGGEKFLTPGFLTINLNLCSHFSPRKYSKLFWQIALYQWAIDMALKDGINIDDIKKTEKFEKLLENYIEPLESALHGVRTYIELAAKIKAIKRTEDLNILGKSLRDYFVAINTYKFNKATFKSAFIRSSKYVKPLSEIAEGFLLISYVFNFYNKSKAIHKVAEQILCLSYLRDSLFFLKRYYSSPSFNLAIRNFKEAEITWLYSEEAYYFTELEFNIASLIFADLMADQLASTVATGGLDIPVIAAIFSETLIIYISTTLLKEGNDFIYYHEIAIRLYTFAFSHQKKVPVTKNEIFLKTYALYLANKIIKEKVLGKGAISKLPATLNFGQEGKWKNYLEIMETEFPDIEEILTKIIKSKEYLSLDVPKVMSDLSKYKNIKISPELAIGIFFLKIFLFFDVIGLTYLLIVLLFSGYSIKKALRNFIGAVVGETFIFYIVFGIGIGCTLKILYRTPIIASYYFVDEIILDPETPKAIRIAAKPIRFVLGIILSDEEETKLRYFKQENVNVLNVIDYFINLELLRYFKKLPIPPN